ncbi:hypothetical protein [Streptomyces canus]|uniref:hypothetical protein n=1 Tax=Streptomyces canus TaxID=58343 RepID=UPI003CF5D32D
MQANNARLVDDWLPAKDGPTDAVKEWHADAPVPYCWTYDPVPGASDWAGTSRCSCSLCVFASRHDVLLSVGWRPRPADLYAEVEHVRGDSFRADWRITDLIRHDAACGAQLLLREASELYQQGFADLRDTVGVPLRRAVRRGSGGGRDRGRHAVRRVSGPRQRPPQPPSCEPPI